MTTFNQRGHPSTPRRPQQGLRRAMKHQGVRHGEKIFLVILLVICLEIGVFTRLYSTIVPPIGNIYQRRTAVSPARPGDSLDHYPATKSPRLALDFVSAAPPRVLFLTDNLNAIQNPEIAVTITKDRQLEPMGNRNCCSQDPFDFVTRVEKPFYETCSPMVEWQTKFYPTCNMIHELPLVDSSDDRRNYINSTKKNLEAPVTLINIKGSWRNVWKVTQQYFRHGDESEPIVLKTLKYNRDFDYESFQLQNVDSMAMERLTSSPYIANEYGFCGQSVLTEYASKSGRDLIKNKHLHIWERVQIAYDLASALSDMHSIDYPHATNATLTHNDINIANTIQGDHGRIKFNDFNIGVLMRWNHTEPCGYPVKFAGPLWRSPEEILAFNARQYIDPAKADVYALGNILFQVLTTHQPWTWLEPDGRPTIEEVIEKKLKGDLPYIPDKFKEVNTSGIQALYYATISCFALNPEDRPTSYQLAHALGTALQWVKGNDKSETSEAVRALFNFSSARKVSSSFVRRARLTETAHLEAPYNMLNQPRRRNTTTKHTHNHRPRLHHELSNKTLELPRKKNREIKAAAAT